jgi:hypothetical protein
VTPPPAATARARAATSPAPLRQPFAPRRVSGPARHPRAAPQAPPRSGRLVARILDAPFLDRLIRGRTWIALVAFAMLGIVAMQVTILRLGATIGRSVTQIQQLTQQNESAETTIAGLEPGRDIAAEAASLGMVYAPAGDVEYLKYRPDDPLLAASLTGPPTVPSIAPAPPGLTASLTPTAVSAQSTSNSAATTTTSSSATTTPASSTTAPSSTTTPASTTAPASSTATPASTTSTAPSGGATVAPGAPAGAASGSSSSGGAVG